MQKYYLKKANESDMDLLFEWVNDPEVRKYSFNEAKVSYEEHKHWFTEKLQSKTCNIFIYYCNDTPIGQIRLNYCNNQAEISYSIDKKYRGKGLGGHLLYLAEQEAIKNDMAEIMYAEVKQSNIASQKKFEQLDYEKEPIIIYKKKIKK